MAPSLELLQPALFFVSFLVIALFLLNFMATKNFKYPPVIKGWIPWFGCAIDFGKEPLNFIKKSTEKDGLIFTVYAAGQRMTMEARSGQNCDIKIAPQVSFFSHCCSFY